MALRFGDLDPSLSPQSLAAVADFGFTHMTPVQASSIPHFLKNKVDQFISILESGIHIKVFIEFSIL
jgi:superfamily II DNA/RNA helicase